jgi:hypothetical protein
MSDGLVEPMNVPPGTQTPVGVQAGVSQAVLLANTLIVFGSAGGIFVYNGTPGLGNAPIFYASAASADPYGNAITPTVGLTGMGQFNAGFTIINVNGIFTYSSVPAFGNLVTSSTGAAGTDPFGNAYLLGLVTYSNISGAFYAEAMQGQQLAWLSAAAAGGPYAALTSIVTTLVGLNSRPQIAIDATEVTFGAGSSAFWDDNAQSMGLPAAGGPFIVNEAFHTIGAAAGTSGLLTGGNCMRVKLLPWNAVWMDIEFENSAANVGGVTFTFGSLPSAAYYPNVVRHFPLSITGNISIAGAIASPRVFVPTSGGIQVVVPTQSAAGTYIASGSIMYPTN